MRIYVDVVTLLPTAELWERSQVIQAAAKRGDGDPLEIQFHRNGVPERLAVGTVISFTVKSAGKYDQNPALVELELGDAQRPDSDTGFYIGEPNYNTAGLNTELASGDANDGNDKAFVICDGEISWLAATIGAKPKSSRTFPLTVHNDVKKGNEGPPASGAPGYLTEAQSDARYAVLTTAPATKSDMSVLPGGVAPLAGRAYLAIGTTGLWSIRHPEIEWRFTDRSSLA